MAGLVDLLLALAWAGSVLVAWTRPGRRPLASLLIGLVLVAIVAGLGVRLEGSAGGRLWSGRLPTTLGLALVMAGAVLHARARAALGSTWAPVPEPGDDLVTRGPYATIRHPAYAGLVLMAIGSVLAHGSLAVGMTATGLTCGLVLKARLEDRRLAARFGERWRRWAASVPAWTPAPFTRRDTPR